MPYFETANLVKAQTRVSDRFKAPEMRMKPTTAFGLLTKNENFLIVGAETLKTRDDRPIEAHLMARTRRNVGNSRTHNHTGTIDDTMKVDLTWTTQSDKTAISLKLLDRSVFEFEEVLANKLAQCCMNILEAKETEAIAWAMGARSQYSLALKGANFNADTDAIEIASANKARFYQLLKAAFRKNNHTGMLDIIADQYMYVDAEYLAAQGGGNAANTQFQFQNMNIVESTDLDDPDYTNGVVLAMPQGTACALNWTPKQNRTGWGDYNTYEGGYGTFDFMGYRFAMHGYVDRADTSASNGDKQDVLMQFELSLDTSYNAAPLSGGNGESVIFEAGVTA